MDEHESSSEPERSAELPVVTAPTGRPVPRVLLAGNPNAGKTSLFNTMTGLRGQTANYPGITVDLRKANIRLPIDARTADQRRIGETPFDGCVDLIDLPGMYGLEPTSPEEVIAADSIRGDVGGDVALVIVVLDATNLARNLFLAEEILELGQPCLIALNMIDVAAAKGIHVDADALAERLDCPVVKVSARTGQGVDDLKQRIAGHLRLQPAQALEGRTSCTVGCRGCTFAARHEWADTICNETTLGRQRSTPAIGRLDRWLTSPLAGTVCLLAVMLSVFFVIFSLADVPMSLIEESFGRVGAQVESWIPVVRPAAWAWMPGVAALSMAVFAIGYRVSELRWSTVSTLCAVVVSVLVALLPLQEFRSLVVDGVIGGIAGVVVFLPQICILFFFIALLEDTGYMARAAFVMERWMRYVGLPGKAFVPMLSAHACAIPGIMATRTIENWRDRLVTILVLPLLTCSARLPVYAMMSALLFAGSPLYAALMFAFAYMLGLAAALASAFCLKRTLLPGEAAPLIIELPPYRIPSLRNALLSAADRASAFLKTAGSVILLISVSLWAMATYPKPPTTASANGAAVSEDALAQSALEYSVAGRVGKALEPVFSPLGFDWKINVGVVTSFAAREVLVSTLSVIYGVGEDAAEDNAGLVQMLRRQKRPDGGPVFTAATSASLLVFFVLAMQCLPTQAVTRRETGSWKWAWFQLVYMTVLAYICAFVTFQGLSAFGLNA